MSTQTATTAFALDYVKTIGIVAVQMGRGFINPYDLVVSRDGRIFVLNRTDSARAALVRVGIVSFDEEYLGEFSKGYGPGDGQFMLPVAMALDSQERLYVTDEHLHRVSIFDLSGDFLGKWGEAGDGEGQFNGPAGIAIDASDHVYVADQHNHRIQKFTADGQYVSQWGGAGDGPGQLNMPWGLAVDTQGSVYVADWRNDRIQKFSPDGEFLDSFGETGTGDGQFHRPSGVAVDPDGYLYIADWGNERLQVLGPDGSFQANLKGQATLSKWAEEFINVNPDEKATRAMANLIPNLPPHLRTPHHISSQTESYFWGPVSVKLDHEGRLYVVEANRHRVQVYQRR
ncbi:MAG TPA: NHL repeat-containing protein [Candidatus Entotheonella sp.]